MDYPKAERVLRRGARLLYNDDYAGKWARPDLPEHKDKNNFGWEPETLFVYYSPYSFKKRGMPLTAMALELWLYGKSGAKRLEKIIEDGSIQYVLRYPISQILKHKPVDVMYEDHLRKAIHQLALFSRQPEQHISSMGNLWRDLQRAIPKYRGDSNANRKTGWKKDIGDWQKGKIYYPSVSVKVTAVTNVDWLSIEPDPSRIDIYGLLGAFSFRSYVNGTVYSDDASKKIFFKPKYIGTRIRDPFDFSDDIDWDFSFATVKAAIYKYPIGNGSQVLGKHMESGTNNVIKVRNVDFRNFEQNFKPRFNEYYRNKKINGQSVSELVCQKYDVVTDYVRFSLAHFNTIDITSLIE